VTVSLVEVDVEAAARATRASSLIGGDVYNDAAKHIGTIDELMLISDRVEFAGFAVGGFLGLGVHLMAMPFEGRSTSVVTASSLPMLPAPSWGGFPGSSIDKEHWMIDLPARVTALTMSMAAIVPSSALWFKAAP
jgi:hypothetical protein